jgi:hypothetical protein
VENLPPVHWLENVAKYSTAVLVTADSVAHAHFTLVTKGYKHKLIAYLHCIGYTNAARSYMICILCYLVWRLCEQKRECVKNSCLWCSNVM